MKILVNGEIKELRAWDYNAGVEWTENLIGDAVTDGFFKWSDELQAYETDQETFEWWEDVIGKLNKIDYTEQNLNEDDMKKYEAENFGGLVDLETETDAKFAWLQERGYIK